MIAVTALGVVVGTIVVLLIIVGIPLALMFSGEDDGSY